MKNILMILCGLSVFIASIGSANASLVTIGTASYPASYHSRDINLIWDNDAPFGSLVWLDYTNRSAMRWNTDAWVESLKSEGDTPNLTIHLLPGYSVTWKDTAWRLPLASNDPPYIIPDYHNGNDYSAAIANSEFAHLWYTELGNSSGSNMSQFGDFNNFWNDLPYWLGNETVMVPGPPEIPEIPISRYFYTGKGSQGTQPGWTSAGGMAVRSGDVAFVSSVPEPATILLLGISLVGLSGLARKKR